jgi:hypothetical protein
MEELEIIELFIDEDNDLNGIQAISIVEHPAIEEDFVALKEQGRLELAKIDEDKRILMGAALIPNKKIYRNNGLQEYYIFFSEGTVRKASELFLTNGKQNNSTLEHDDVLEGLSVVESWIIEDDVKDKSRKYNLNMPVGTWMVSVKVNNEDIWKEFVKTKRVKGFSIEGFFSDKLEMNKQVLEELTEEEKGWLNKIEQILKDNK